jgi:hypothetical protein
LSASARHRVRRWSRPPAAAPTSASSNSAETGTVVLFLGSYAFQPRVDALWGGPEVDKIDSQVAVANRRRLIMQRAGLALLCASFVLQFAAVFLP